MKAGLRGAMLGAGLLAVAPAQAAVLRPADVPGGFVSVYLAPVAVGERYTSILGPGFWGRLVRNLYIALPPQPTETAMTLGTPAGVDVRGAAGGWAYFDDAPGETRRGLGLAFLPQGPLVPALVQAPARAAAPLALAGDFPYGSSIPRPPGRTPAKAGGGSGQKPIPGPTTDPTPGTDPGGGPEPDPPPAILPVPAPLGLVTLGTVMAGFGIASAFRRGRKRLTD